MLNYCFFSGDAICKNVIPVGNGTDVFKAEQTVGMVEVLSSCTQDVSIFFTVDEFACTNEEATGFVCYRHRHCTVAFTVLNRFVYGIPSIWAVSNSCRYTAI